MSLPRNGLIFGSWRAFPLEREARRLERALKMIKEDTTNDRSVANQVKTNSLLPRLLLSPLDSKAELSALTSFEKVVGATIDAMSRKMLPRRDETALKVPRRGLRLEQSRAKGEIKSSTAAMMYAAPRNAETVPYEEICSYTLAGIEPCMPVWSRLRSLTGLK